MNCIETLIKQYMFVNNNQIFINTYKYVDTLIDAIYDMLMQIYYDLSLLKKYNLDIGNFKFNNYYVLCVYGKKYMLDKYLFDSSTCTITNLSKSNIDMCGGDNLLNNSINILLNYIKSLLGFINKSESIDKCNDKLNVIEMKDAYTFTDKQLLIDQINKLDRLLIDRSEQIEQMKYTNIDAKNNLQKLVDEYDTTKKRSLYVKESYEKMAKQLNVDIGVYKALRGDLTESKIDKKKILESPFGDKYRILHFLHKNKKELLDDNKFYIIYYKFYEKIMKLLNFKNYIEYRIIEYLTPEDINFYNNFINTNHEDIRIFMEKHYSDLQQYYVDDLYAVNYLLDQSSDDITENKYEDEYEDECELNLVDVYDEYIDDIIDIDN